MQLRSLVVTAAMLLGVSQVAHAALFGDDEARRKITDLQQQMQTQQQATQAALDDLKQKQQALEQRHAQSLSELLGRIDNLNQQINQLQGQLEVANHNLEMAQQRQKDLYTDTDSRLRKLESAPSAAAAVPPATPAIADGQSPYVLNNQAQPGSESVATNSTEAKDFETAQGLLRSGKYKESFEAYQKFLQSYPASQQSPDALYGLGYSQFSLKNYKAAIATQQKLLKQYPDSAKAPEASFNIANSQIQLADVEGAKKTLRELLSKYPSSEVAPRAKSRLAILESIKK